MLGVGRLGRVTATPPKDNDGGLWFPRYTELLTEHVSDQGTRDPVLSFNEETSKVDLGSGRNTR